MYVSMELLINNVTSLNVFYLFVFFIGGTDYDYGKYCGIKTFFWSFKNMTNNMLDKKLCLSV